MPLKARHRVRKLKTKMLPDAENRHRKKVPPERTAINDPKSIPVLDNAAIDPDSNNSENQEESLDNDVAPDEAMSTTTPGDTSPQDVSSSPTDPAAPGEQVSTAATDPASPNRTTSTTTPGDTSPQDVSSSPTDPAAPGEQVSTAATDPASPNGTVTTSPTDAWVDIGGDSTATAPGEPASTVTPDDGTTFPTDPAGGIEGDSTETATTTSSRPFETDSSPDVDFPEAGSSLSRDSRDAPSDAGGDLTVGDGEDCRADTLGSYGNVDGNAAKTIVSYRYEIETNSTYDYGVSQQEGAATAYLEEVILPALETKISDGLLAILFPLGCRRRLRSNGHRSSTSRKLVVVGLSPQPNDDIDDSATCTQQEDANENYCNVVQGGLTLHTDSDSKNETLATLTAIREGMDSGNFASAHPAIEKITFIEEDFSNAVSADNTRSEVSANNSQLSALPFVTLGSVAAVLLAALVLYRRRKKNDDDNDSDLDDDASSELEVSHTSSADNKDTAIGIHRNPAAPLDLYGLSSDSEMESSYDRSYASLTPRSTDLTAPETMMFTEMDSSLSSSDNGRNLMPTIAESGGNRLLGDDLDKTSDHGYDDDFLYKS